VALAVQQSLFEAGGEAPMAESAHWIERVMLGDVALGLCVIAVAIIGAVMLGGRLPVREGMRTVLGFFVVLGAPVIADRFLGNFGETFEMSQPQPAEAEGVNVWPELPPADFDPYAGASLRAD
jgi:type IV secretion system protein VirB2